MTKGTGQAGGEVTAAKWTAAAVIIAAFIAGAFTLIPKFMDSSDSIIPPSGSLPAPIGENSSAPDLEVMCVIKTPSPGELVRAEVSAIGTATNVATGQKIWLIVQSGSGYYPQASISLPPNGIGDWAERVFFGGDGDAGKIFTLYAVAADEAANSRFKNYVEEVERGLNPRALEAGKDYPNLPILAQVTVVRE